MVNTVFIQEIEQISNSQRKTFQMKSPSISTKGLKQNLLMLSQISALLIFAASNFQNSKTLDTSRCASLLSAHTYSNKPNHKAYSWIPNS